MMGQIVVIVPFYRAEQKEIPIIAFVDATVQESLKLQELENRAKEGNIGQRYIGAGSAHRFDSTMDKC